MSRTIVHKFKNSKGPLLFIQYAMSHDSLHFFLYFPLPRSFFWKYSIYLINLELHLHLALHNRFQANAPHVHVTLFYARSPARLCNSFRFSGYRFEWSAFIHSMASSIVAIGTNSRLLTTKMKSALIEMFFQEKKRNRTIQFPIKHFDRERKKLQSDSSYVWNRLIHC